MPTYEYLWLKLISIANKKTLELRRVSPHNSIRPLDQTYDYSVSGVHDQKTFLVTIVLLIWQLEPFRNQVFGNTPPDILP